MPASQGSRARRAKVLRRKRTVLLSILATALCSTFAPTLPVLERQVETRRPIMQLSAPPHKGIHNQMSTIVTGLYLAVLLGWDVMVPMVYSPLNCADMSAGCYEYNTFLPFNFSLFFDQRFFVDFIEREYGLRVYTDASCIPEYYVRLRVEESPCPSGCRFTYTGLFQLYSPIDSASIVQAPGIAAAILDSDEHAEGLLHAMSALRESPVLSDYINKQLLSWQARNTTIVAVHWRFESDVTLKSEKLSDERIFYEAFLKELRDFTNSDLSQAAVVFVGGQSSTEHKNDGFRVLKLDEMLTDEFPEIQALLNITFIKSVIHNSLASQADFFVGHSWSSFSAFTAARRYRDRLPSTLIPSQAPYNCELLNRGDAATHWQYELTLPLQDCVVEDPCLTLHTAKSKRSVAGYMDLKFGCPYARGTRTRTHDDTSICTGMTLLRQRCSSKLPSTVHSSNFTYVSH